METKKRTIKLEFDIPGPRTNLSLAETDRTIACGRNDAPTSLPSTLCWLNLLSVRPRRRSSVIESREDVCSVRSGFQCSANMVHVLFDGSSPVKTVKKAQAIYPFGKRSVLVCTLLLSSVLLFAVLVVELSQ